MRPLISALVSAAALAIIAPALRATQEKPQVPPGVERRAEAKPAVIISGRNSGSHRRLLSLRVSVLQVERLPEVRCVARRLLHGDQPVQPRQPAVCGAGS